MFPIKCKRSLPVQKVVINSISVRGRLGPLTVWVTKDDKDSPSISCSPVAKASRTEAASSPYSLRGRFNITKKKDKKRSVVPQQGEISMKKIHWDKIYSKTHGPSFTSYCELDLSAKPIEIVPGQVRGIYIHSTLEGDEAIVYDNKHKMLTHDDSFLTILPGRAHVSDTPFGRMPIWGWGNAWRDNREFVGRLSYGVVYRLWNPAEHLAFGSQFQRLAMTLFACQRRSESPMSLLGDDCVFYILNMCKWDWAVDSHDIVAAEQKQLRKGRKRKEAAIAAKLEEERRNSEATVGSVVVEDDRKVAAESLVDNGNTSHAPGSGSLGDSLDMNVDGSVQDGEAEEDGAEEWVEEEMDSDDEDYPFDDYRGMDPRTFYYRDYEEEDSDDENRVETQMAEIEENRRRHWLRNQFARVHVLNALASMNDGGGGEVEADSEDADESSDEEYIDE